MENTKLTKLEKYWILYDVGNSAFILLAITILPIYFSYLAEQAGISEVNYLAYWGYATSLATLLVAIIGPIVGTLADTKGYKKPIFTMSMMVGVLGCAALSVPRSWVIFLAMFVITKVGYSASLIFYDAMLVDVTSPERLDYVSSHGYAWGYIGSCIPFIISLVFVLFGETIGITMKGSMTISFLLNAGWWFFVTIPLLRNYKQTHHSGEADRQAVKTSLKRLVHVLKDMKSHKNIFVFLLAFSFYIDGVYTIISMATVYGSALGLDAQGLLLALLLTQIVAFPFALLFGKAAKKHRTENLIQVCILAYLFIALFAIQLDRQWEFWVLAVCVGMFQGAVQALSRSYFAKIIPPEKSGEFFGLFDTCGKGASFIGTALMGLFAQLTGKPSGGISMLAVMFVIGLLLFRKAIALNPKEEESPCKNY
ncbi:MAG: MFS transporter [Hungatella sp.]